MYLRNYKTDKQKRDHISKYWQKDSLFDLVDSYTEDDPELHTQMMSCKTKKELLEKFLPECWDIVCEEYSYA